VVSGQLSGSPASVGPPNNKNRSAAGRIGRGEQRITDNRAKGASAFTLIEMTVVILIIGTLATLLMTGASRMFDRAKKAQAKDDLTQIVTAVSAFYTEYGIYLSTTTPEMTYDGTAGKTNNLLFDILRAVNTTVNTRGIVFISPRFAVGTTGTPRGGISQVAATRGQYMDPYGKPYIIRLDTNFDNAVTNPYSTNAGPVPLSFPVIAWSFGKDTLSGSIPGPATDKSSGTSADDVLSWQ
jgi:prepilin-type N-terminal cleavage/methylation domain-containing protein